MFYVHNLPVYHRKRSARWRMAQPSCMLVAKFTSDIASHRQHMYQLTSGTICTASPGMVRKDDHDFLISHRRPRMTKPSGACSVPSQLSTVPELGSLRCLFPLPIPLSLVLPLTRGSSIPRIVLSGVDALTQLSSWICLNLIFFFILSKRFSTGRTAWLTVNLKSFIT